MATLVEEYIEVRALVKAPGGINVLMPVLDVDNDDWIDSIRQDYPDARFETRVITTITRDWGAAP